MAASAVNSLSKVGDLALPGPGVQGLSAMSTNTSAPSSPMPDAGGCENGALMDSLGIFLQGLLAVLAFSILMCKYDEVNPT